MKRVKGVIVERRRTPKGNQYTLFDGEKFHTFETDKNIRSKSISVDGDDIEELGEEVLKEVKARFFERAKYGGEIPPFLKGVSDVFERLWKEIAFAKITRGKVQVFYDADADGIISALLLSEVVKTSLKPLRPYQLEIATGLFPDFSADFYVILDMGSGDTPGVKFLSRLRDTYVVDHHITDTCIVPCVNPARNNPEASKYFTALIVSHLVGQWIKRDEWLRVAAAGDRSEALPWTKKDREKALALELSTELLPQTPQTWKSVLEDLWRELYEIVKYRFEVIDEMAQKEERTVEGQRVLIVSYPPAGFSYPHRGKVASWYMERGYDMVVVVEAERTKEYTVSIRSSRNIYWLIKKVEERGIGRGWGHPNAISIRTPFPHQVLKLAGIEGV